MTPERPHPGRCSAVGRSGRRHTAASDAEATRLALAARDGDARTADLFVRALHHDVRTFVAHLSPDPQEVDDLTQEVFVRALVGLPRFEGRSAARVWLLTIARRTVVDSFRYAAARPRRADREDWCRAAEEAQPRDLPGFEEGVALRELLATIRADGRDAFVVTQLLGFPYAEAATILGCRVGTVRSRVARARTALAGLVGEAEAESEASVLAGA